MGSDHTHTSIHCNCITANGTVNTNVAVSYDVREARLTDARGGWRAPRKRERGYRRERERALSSLSSARPSTARVRTGRPRAAPPHLLSALTATPAPSAQRRVTPDTPLLFPCFPRAFRARATDRCTRAISTSLSLALSLSLSLSALPSYIGGDRPLARCDPARRERRARERRLFRPPRRRRHRGQEQHWRWRLGPRRRRQHWRPARQQWRRLSLVAPPRPVAGRARVDGAPPHAEGDRARQARRRGRERTAQARHSDATWHDMTCQARRRGRERTAQARLSDMT